MKKRLLTLTLIVCAILFVYTKVDTKVSDHFNETQAVAKPTKVEARDEIHERDFQAKAVVNNIQKNSLSQSKDSIEDKKEYKKPSMVRDEAIFVSLDNGQNDLLISYLEDKGNPNLKNNEGVSLLSASAMNGDLKSVDYLIKSGADINRPDNNGTTPLMNAIMGSTAEGEFNDIIDTLIEAGANLNTTDNQGLTAVHMAVEINDPKIMEKILKAGAKQTKLPEGLTPIMMAAANGSTKVLPILAKHGGKIDERGPNGRTALMLAASNNNFPEVRMLVAMGSNEGLKDTSGKTASDYAASTDNELIKAFLSDER